MCSRTSSIPPPQDLQKEVAQLLSRNQSLEEDLTGWRQKVESLEITNFDLQERLVAIGSLVEAVRSEISDYCPSCEETAGGGEVEVEVEQEEKVDFRLQGNVIEGRLQLVMTGCSRITEDLATLQQQRDELQMVSLQFSCTCTHQLTFLFAASLSSSSLCLFSLSHLFPLILLFYLFLSCSLPVSLCFTELGSLI